MMDLKGFATLSLLVTSCWGLACVEKSEGPSPVKREQVASLISSKAPRPEHEAGVDFENKIELIGYDLEPETIAPGKTLKVTWYWKVKKPLEEGWRQFTHVADAKGNNRINADNRGPVRSNYPAGHWKKGEHIKDPQKIHIPKDWGSSKVKLYIGFWNGPHRLHISGGKGTKDNRLLAATVPVGGDEPEQKVQQRLTAKRLDGKLKLDGKLTEPVWKDAQKSGAFVHTLTGKKTEPRSHVRALFDASHLYVAFEVEDEYLKSDKKKHDDHLWEQDAVEILVSPEGDDGYFEIQASPAGVVFDTRYDSRRTPRPFGHLDWDSKAEVGVNARGKLNDDAEDKGYTVEMALPWTSFVDDDDEKKALPPTGQEWRINFFVLDAVKSGQRAAGWSAPKVGDFHVPERFGFLQIGEPTKESQEDDDASSKKADEETKGAEKAAADSEPEGEKKPKAKGETAGSKKQSPSTKPAPAKKGATEQKGAPEPAEAKGE